VTLEVTVKLLPRPEVRHRSSWRPFSERRERGRGRWRR
jgi:hypothetical protein